MTRAELLPENLAEFRQRFGTLHDGVIHSVHYDLFSVTEPQKISVVVGTRDWQAETDDNWLNLTFEIENVTSLILKSPKNYYSGIVFSLGIGFF